MTEKLSQAEIIALRDFIDFVNAQVGVYMDGLAGFQGNVARVSRQVARIQRKVGQRTEAGVPVMVWASFEDPTRPDAIHHRIIRAQDFVRANEEAGLNEQQLCRSIIVFMFAFWDEEIRPQVAAARGVDPNEIKVDVFGDLRIVRNAIIHTQSVLSVQDHSRLRKLAPLLKAGGKIVLGHEEMHQLFVAIKQAITELLIRDGKDLPGAPDPTTIIDIAVQNAGPRKPID